MSGILLGFGNPLLDIGAHVDAAFLKKYELDPNGVILADPAKHSSIYRDVIDNYQVEYLAGGSSQNALRGAQRLLPAGSTGYIGCVSNDKFADILRSEAKKDGLEVAYQINTEVATGCCAMLITNHDRSLVTDLRAASRYSVSHLQQPEIWSMVEKAQYYYIEGFFFTVSMDTIMQVATHASKHNKVFSMNLSAPFVSELYLDLVQRVLPYLDILIGNQDEAAAYVKASGLSLVGNEAIAQYLSGLPKANPARERIVVLTHGPDRTCVSIGGRPTQVFPVPRIDESQISDTNGAGDAFVGGFLSQLILGQSIERAIEIGHWLASQVIRLTGAQYPRDLELP